MCNNNYFRSIALLISSENHENKRQKLSKTNRQTVRNLIDLPGFMGKELQCNKIKLSRRWGGGDNSYLEGKPMVHMRSYSWAWPL